MASCYTQALSPATSGGGAGAGPENLIDMSSRANISRLVNHACGDVANVKGEEIRQDYLAEAEAAGSSAHERRQRRPRMACWNACVAPSSVVASPVDTSDVTYVEQK